MTRVAVVILNFNGLALLQKYLPSVVQYTGEARLVVADNGSSDGSIAWLAQQHPAIEIVRIGTNLGFAGGYNFALAQVKEEYSVLLNSDVEVTEGWLAPLIQLLDQDSGVVAAQPKIISYAVKSRFEHAGAAGGFIDALGYPFCRGRIFHCVEEDTGQYDESRPVFWATGACMIIRTADYFKAGGLDEDFFAHMEEIDLCWRLQRAGKVIQCVGKSKVYHLGGGTLSVTDPRKVFLNFRNGLSLLVKNTPTAQLIIKFPLRIMLDWIATLKFLLGGSPRGAGAVIRAHYHFMKRLRSILKKRRESGSRYPVIPTMYRGLLIWDFFVRGRKKFSDLRF